MVLVSTIRPCPAGFCGDDGTDFSEFPDRTFLIVFSGWVFARRRTVTGMILAAEAVGTKHHSAFHRVFASAPRSLDELGPAGFRLILPWLDERDIVLALDDTLARQRGLKVHGVGMHHDALLRTRKTAIMNWGHNWVVLGVIVRLPFTPDQCFSLRGRDRL